jgi:hypothetical protein
VVLAAGIAALSLWPEPGPEQLEPPPVWTAETADLIRETQDNIDRIQFTPAGEAPYTIRRNPTDGEFTLDSAGMVFEGNPSMMRTIFSTAVSLTNLNVVTTQADDGQLSMFGFDAPVMTWRVYRTDGTVSGFMLGTQQVAGQGFYAREENSREVVLVSQWQSGSLTKVVEDIYNLSFFPQEIFFGAETVMDVFDIVLIEKEDEVVELHRRPNEVLFEMGLGTSRYKMLQPLESDCNDYIIENSILDNIITIEPESVEAKHPADLSVYGLDSPVRLTLSAQDWSKTLLIGRHDIERGGRYVMIEGYDAVLFDPSGDYSFLNISTSQLRARIIWIHNIVEVASVEFELEGVKRVLEFEHDHENQSLEGWLDGAEISEVNARRLYIGILSITQTDETDAQIPNAPPVYNVTIRFLDGSSETIDLYYLNDTQFLIVHNGVNTGFFITRMTLQRGLLNRFDILDRGEDLPAS